MSKVFIGGIGSTKTWRETVNPITKKFKLETDKLFAAYNKEIKAKGITTTAEHNELWREKYSEKFNKIDKRHAKEYKKAFLNFHKL